MLAKTLPFFVALGLSAQTLTSNPAQIQFGAGAGLSSPATINVKLTNSTGPSATVSVTTDQPWLSASPSSLATGSTSKIAISVNIAGLAAKTYTGNVIFTAPGYTSATTAVTLIVANPSNTLLPVAGTAGPSQANDFGVVVADLNNDGKLDVATLNGDTGQVAVLLGDGSGGFTAGSGSPALASSDLFAMAVGDFNGDGKADLAITQRSSLTIHILLGDGAGGFAAASGSPITTGLDGNWIVTADFNRDGNLDLAILGFGQQQAAVFAGDGHGGFTIASGSPFATGLFPAGLVVGDFNGDGSPDLAASNNGGFTVYLNDGTAEFTALPVTVPGADNLGQLAVADFNGDGNLDIALGSLVPNQIYPYLGDGNGGFKPANVITIAEPYALAAGDFNGDGNIDLLVNGNNGASMFILLGDGAGNFTPAWSNPLWPSASFLFAAVADFNGDGRLDVATAGAGVFLGAAMAPSTITLSTPMSTVASGQNVTLSATIASPSFAAPTGTVQFLDGSTVLGSTSLSGTSAMFSTAALTMGQHMLYADYSGDRETAPSTSAGVMINVVVPSPQPYLNLVNNAFTQGEQGATFSLTVGNIGNGPTSGMVVVTVTVESWFTLVSLAGPGWTCLDATCTRSDPLPAGSNYRAITATINVTGNPGPVSNTVSVSGGGYSSFSMDFATSINVATAVFGYFDTPADFANGLYGAIAVTGWALSQAGIANVAIWREPVGSESVGGNGLVFIGTATMVPGTRPDVATAFPGYPGNNSGWGLQVLTNMLPNSGNGTYRIHAIATDNNNQSVDLAVKTITVDNKDAVLPFGTIDTPTQGGTASGSAYANFGWALTPVPINVIPKDGSTIVVYIDDQPMGHPVYNNYRVDIAMLFPGLQNSNGAVGYFRIDTTRLTNGLHTISWGVHDSAGHEQGLGSRYFIVQN